MQRFLPPLLVLTVLGIVAVRTALQPSRAEAQEQIAGYVQGVELERALRELEAYLGSHSDAEDLWFAARMYLRLRAPDKAIDTIWGNAALASAPGTGRRFAVAGLHALGWDDDARTEPNVLEPRALVTLVEGGDPWSRARLTEHAATLDLMDTIAYFFPAYRNASSPPMKVIVEAFRGRDDEKFATAAALGALQPDDYPGKADDLTRLLEVLASASWRRQYRDVWCVACLALGRSGDPRALAALKRQEARLEQSQRRRDREDLLLVRNGLLAAGVWEAEASLVEHISGDDLSPLATVWYGEALIHRYRLGDTRSEASLLRYWMGPGARFGDLRFRLARAFLLQDDPPSADAASTWVVTRMLPGLERDDMPLMAHVLAMAHRLRTGEDGAREKLLELMRTAHGAFTTGSQQAGDTTGPFLEALRALYLYD